MSSRSRGVGRECKISSAGILDPYTLASEIRALINFMPIQVGSAVRFKDNSALRGVVFEFQDDGAVAGLNCLSKKLADSGCG